jgi:hypothetical protein
MTVIQTKQRKSCTSRRWGHRHNRLSIPTRRLRRRTQRRIRIVILGVRVARIGLRGSAITPINRVSTRRNRSPQRHIVRSLIEHSNQTNKLLFCRAGNSQVKPIRRANPLTVRRHTNRFPPIKSDRSIRPFQNRHVNSLPNNENANEVFDARTVTTSVAAKVKPRVNTIESLAFNDAS